MPLNSARVLEIIEMQTEKVENRHAGWSDKIHSLANEILELERYHIVNNLPVESSITDKIDVAALELHQKRKESGEFE